ncbi:unannotated protein [freshwater metagenome]|uniref:Unannotated protein n=1 Tax=freshwater metagenome TaxID=449393 RepID=A0A6J6X4N0_9ZZZZ
MVCSAASWVTTQPRPVATSEVIGPIDITAACGEGTPPRTSVRFFTVEPEVNVTRSTSPLRTCSRRTGSGSARTVRYTSRISTEKPRAVKPSGSTSRASSALAMSTRAPSPVGSGIASSSDSATKRSGSRSQRNPRAASDAAVPGPIAATFTPQNTRASSPATSIPLSKNPSTPLGEVKMIHSKPPSSGRVTSRGSILMDGSSSTSAPRISSLSRSELACSRARVTTMRAPRSGRCSNHEKSRAATSPTTIADGERMPASPASASVVRSVCCSGRVP